MSDPMTDSEVEDVLASIRRLVSDDNRPDLKPSAHVVTDRLVLTPSLRVMEDDGDGASDAPPAENIDDTSKPPEAAAESDALMPEGVMVAPRAPLHAVPEQSAAPDDVLTAPGDDGDGDVQGHAIADDAHGIQEENAHEIDEEDAHIVQEEDAHKVENIAAPDVPVDEPTIPTRPDIVEDASTFVAPKELSVSDGTPDAQTDLDAWPETESTDAAPVPVDWTQDDDAPFVLGDAVTDEDAATDPAPESTAQTLGEKVAALETLVGNRGGNFEPDDTDVGANAGTEPPAMAWEDADATDDEAPAYAAFIGALPNAEPEPEEEPTAQVFSADEEMLDEESLRDLVSDIVREELQGALGERITRNVRKLVRREIHRALASQDLE